MAKTSIGRLVFLSKWYGEDPIQEWLLTAVGQLGERMSGGQRLGGHHVETGGGDATGAQSVDQRVLVDDGAPARVHQHGRRFHLRQSCGVDQTARRLRQRTGDDDHVRLAQQVVQRHQFGAHLLNSSSYSQFSIEFNSTTSTNQVTCPPFHYNHSLVLTRQHYQWKSRPPEFKDQPNPSQRLCMNWPYYNWLKWRSGCKKPRIMSGTFAHL